MTPTPTPTPTPPPTCVYEVTPNPSDPVGTPGVTSATTHFTSVSGFDGEFALYLDSDLETPLFTCTVFDSLPFSALAALAELGSGLFVVVLRGKGIEETPFTLTITGEAGSIEIPSSLLPAAYEINVSPHSLSHQTSQLIALVEWTAGEAGTLTIKDPYGDPYFVRSADVTVWSPVLLETTTIYSLSNTGGNLTLVMSNGVHRWGANEGFRFYIINDNEFHIYPCPDGYSVTELLYEASNVGGGIFTFGPTDGNALQYTPRLSKKTYYGGCFANGEYKLTFEHSAGDERVWVYNMGNYYGRYDNRYYSHTEYLTISHMSVSIRCEGDDVPVWFESSLHCLIDQYGADNEFALTPAPTPFVICMKNDTLFRIRALSFEGGHIRATVNGVTADYELSNFGEGWLKVGTGAVAPPEGYAGYYELTNEVSELPIPAGVQTLFVNRLNGTEYREFDLADYPLLQFFAVLGNNTVIGVKAEGHANLRLVNITMTRRIDRDNTVFSVKDCPQLASISLSYVSVASFAINSSSRVLPSRVALPSLTYFYAFETVHTATTLQVEGT